MNTLLIYPEFPETFWSLKHALKFVRKRSTSPPLGLLTVAALLPRDWHLRLVDLNVRRLKDDDVAWADCAFISAMAVQRPSALSVIARCKAGNLRVVAGGPLFTSEEGRLAGVDHFVLNEAELTLPPFLADLERGEPGRVYETAAFPDLSRTPAPRWDLLDFRRYAEMSVQYSRGCPYNCDFCNVTALFGHQPRTKTAQQIIAELDGLDGLGWRGSVFFVDDNLIGHKRRLKAELLPALIEWRRSHPGFSFHTEVSINLADDPDLMRLMVEAGFSIVFIGIETPDEVCLAECSKRQNTNRDLVADVKRIQRAGLEVQGGFIVGFDSDKPSIFQRQIDFIQKSGIVTAMVGLLQAPSGTRLYERLKGEGRLLGHFAGDNVNGTTNFVPVMDREALLKGYRKVLRHIYSPKHYYERLRTFLREYRLPATEGPARSDGVLPFLRSVWRLGIIGRERYHYWKLLIWTQFRRPELMPVAVTLAIYGFHFRKVCEQQRL